jgi:hypothetical protein
MTHKPKIPDCPRCKTNRHAVPNGDRQWFCHGCKGLFDDEPDEGGTYYSDPSKRLEKQEDFQQRQEKRGRRR